MIDYTQMVQDVLEGNESGLKAYAILSVLKKDIDKAISEIKDLALIESEKYGAKSFEDFGFKFERRNGAARYSFKNITEWCEVKSELNDIEKKAKQAYSSYKNGLSSFNNEDGSEIELPEVTYSTDSLIVK